MKVQFVVVLAVLAMFAAVGCTAAEEDTAASEETTVGDKAGSAPPLKTQEETTQAKTQTQYDSGDDLSIRLCQVDEAAKANGASIGDVGTADNTEQGAFINDVYKEARERGVEPQQVLSERGYDCGWSALQQSREKG
jgi:hypothetical protein